MLITENFILDGGYLVFNFKKKFAFAPLLMPEKIVIPEAAAVSFKNFLLSDL
jgi:hypothetical protein